MKHTLRLITVVQYLGDDYGAELSILLMSFNSQGFQSVDLHPMPMPMSFNSQGLKTRVELWSRL